MSYTQQYENSTDEFASSKWDNKWGNADPDNPNYINWIMYDIKQKPEYQDYEFWHTQTINHNRPTFSQNVNFEGNYINNKGGIDILAATAEYNTSNVTNEYFTAPPSLQNTMNFSRNPNIEQSAEIDIVDKTSDENMSQDKDDLDIYPKFQEHDAQEEPQDSIPEQNNNIPQLSNILEEDNIDAEDPSNLYNTLILEEIRKKRKELNQQELLLKNEKQEILKFLNQSGPPDNMRNRKKTSINSQKKI